jgi:hypothetical protein
MTTDHLTRLGGTPKTPFIWVTLLTGAAIGVAILSAAEYRVATGQAPDLNRAFEHLLPLDNPAAMANFTA